MKLRSIKTKDKQFIFEAYDNKLSENPAKIIFRRFPFPDETYPIVESKTIMKSSELKNLGNDKAAQERLVENIIDNIINNITANRIDLHKFFTECVERIEDLEYDGAPIKTVEHFFEHLPTEAIYKIGIEAYLYSKEEDVLTNEEKKS